MGRPQVFEVKERGIRGYNLNRCIPNRIFTLEGSGDHPEHWDDNQESHREQDAIGSDPGNKLVIFLVGHEANFFFAHLFTLIHHVAPSNR